MGVKTLIATGVETIPNFLIVRTKRVSTSHWLPADVRMGTMRCNIGENQTIFCRRVDHKYAYKAKTN